MERQVRRDSKIMWMLKALLVSYIVTTLLLMGLTMLLYKFELDEKIVSASIVAIYVTSTLVGGIIMGKLVRVKRFWWGMILGVLYFALLLAITLGVYRTLNGDGVNLMTTLILCAGGGMTGGMIS
ncbi:MAG: TIGR04086 family membrane protein [Dorea sp.]